MRSWKIFCVPCRRVSASSHVFVSGGPGPDRRDLERDDVIFLQAGRFPGLPEIRGAAKADARIILLAPDPAEAAGLPDGIWDHIDDLWAGPCGAAALAARFGRLLDGLKLQRDSRLAHYYLDTVINATPSLIWFKDAAGRASQGQRQFLPDRGQKQR